MPNPETSELPVGSDDLVRIPREFALRAINALSYRYNKVMDDPNTHGKDCIAKILMEGAASDKRAMAVISAAISDANADVEARPRCAPPQQDGF
jgi:hypothetical protein